MIIYVTCKDMERTTTGTGREDELEEERGEGGKIERERKGKFKSREIRNR